MRCWACLTEGAPARVFAPDYLASKRPLQGLCSACMDCCARLAAIRTPEEPGTVYERLWVQTALLRLRVRVQHAATRMEP